MVMAPGSGHHDRVTASPSRDTAPDGAAVAGALSRLRLDGAIFFRAEFTEDWAYVSPPPDQVAAILRPGAQRLIMFHIVATGRCWVTAGGERHWANEGDVIVLPYGDQHSVGGSSAAPPVPILDLFTPPPWQSLPVVRHGSGGDRTNIVCGYLHSEDTLFDPALGALPPVFVVTPPEGPAATWIRSSVDYALAAGDSAKGPLPPYPDPGSTKLSELVLIEVLRQHLATAPAIESGWIAALADPVLAPAMAAMHAAPERRWTVTDLAARAAVSRSVLDERFRQVLGRSPIRYLTDWRMHQAEELLATTELSVAAVGRRIGYDSEEAFSRAFKRDHKYSPGAWRQSRRRQLGLPRIAELPR
jgi:AraC-like DNA-binding protein